MPRHITIAFPGQGSQHPEMFSCFSDNTLNKIKNDVIEALNFDLFEMSKNDNELNKTSITQPAILLASYLQFEFISETTSIKPDLLCGHSLGEYTALVAAGSIDLIDAIKLVHQRGILMENSNKGQMYAILNAPLELITKCSFLASKELNQIVSPSNINSPNQVVISGDTEAVDLTVKYLKEHGVKKCIKLNVSVPSHCDLMRKSAEQFEEIVNETHFKEPKCKIIHNVDATSTSNITEIKTKLVNQLTKPVQWVQTMEYIKQYDTIFVECGPNKVLSSLAKANSVDNIYSSSSEDFVNKIEQIL